MKLKKLNPITNGSRHVIRLQKNLLAKNSRLVRSIFKKKQKRNGRSFTDGHITSWQKGGGVKGLYKNVNFSNSKTNAVVISTCYDPYRNGFVTFNFELNTKKFFFDAATNSTFPGSLIKNSPDINELKLGYRTKIKNIPAGSVIHSLTINDSLKTQYIRSAGTFGQIVQRGLTKAKVKLPSKKIIEVSVDNYATIGVMSNLVDNQRYIGKAGTNRLLGKRPTVRGIAMNPVDHPHGGRSNGGIPSVTPWGLPTKCGFYLRKKKNK